MPPDPLAEPTDQPPDPAQDPSSTTGPSPSERAQKPAKDDLPNADAAEPEPHEHLPPRSDDN